MSRRAVTANAEFLAFEFFEFVDAFAREDDLIVGRFHGGHQHEVVALQAGLHHGADIDDRWVAGDQSLRVNLVGMEGAQAELMRARRRHPGAPDIPADDLIPSFPAASDMLGTGWFGIIAAEAGPGKTIAVVGNGAVGLLGCEKPGPPGPLRSRKGQSTKSAICATGRFTRYGAFYADEAQIIPRPRIVIIGWT